MHVFMITHSAEMCAVGVALSVALTVHNDIITNKKNPTNTHKEKSRSFVIAVAELEEI